MKVMEKNVSVIQKTDAIIEGMPTFDKIYPQLSVNREYIDEFNAKN
jgi:hypothetical protein